MPQEKKLVTKDSDLIKSTLARICYKIKEVPARQLSICESLSASSSDPYNGLVELHFEVSTLPSW